MSANDDRHDNRYEDGGLFEMVAAIAYREWFDKPRPTDAVTAYADQLQEQAKQPIIREDRP